MIRAALVVAVALHLAGCAGPPRRPDEQRGEPGRSARPVTFPLPAEVRRLAEAPAPPLSFGESAASPLEWTLKGPFPDRVEPIPHPNASPWERALIPTVKEVAEPSGNLACAAREAAAFWLQTGSPMQGDVLEFAVARCGGAFAGLASGHFTGEVPASADDKQWIDHWSAEVRDYIRGLGRQGAMGFAAARSGKKAVVFIVAGRRAATLEPLPVASGSATFDVRGEVLEPAGRIWAKINRGRFDVEECVSDPLVRPPRFSFRCEADAKDPVAWIEIAASASERILGTTVARLAVTPSGGGAAVFRREAIRSDSEASASSRAFVDRLNEVRAGAGLRPLELEARQSETVVRLAPHYFTASRGEESEARRADRLVLAAIAGWDVGGGVIQYGHMVEGVAAGPDLGAALSSMLLYPLDRDRLLDPDVSRIAAAIVRDPAGNGMGVFAVTFRMQTRKSALEEGAQVMAQLNRARAMHRLQPAV